MAGDGDCRRRTLVRACLGMRQRADFWFQIRRLHHGLWKSRHANNYQLKQQSELTSQVVLGILAQNCSTASYFPKKTAGLLRMYLFELARLQPTAE